MSIFGQHKADVLIVEGDALADISAISNVRRVLRDGVTVHDASTAGAALEWLMPLGHKP